MAEREAAPFSGGPPHDTETVSPLSGVAVERIMSGGVVTIDADATMRESQALMDHYGVHHLLVLHQGRLVGVFSDRDLLRRISPFVGTLSEQERDARTLLRRVFQSATYQVVTIRSDAPIEEAAALLLEHGISCLPVMNSHDALVGIVTTRDLLRGMIECVLPGAA